MTRVLISLFVVTLIIGGLVIYFFVFPSNQKPKLEEQEQPLHVQITDNLKQSEATTSASPSATDKALVARVSTLEKTVADLQQQIKTLQTAKATSSAPLYIPLGSGGSSSAFDWTTIDTYKVDINPDYYVGYTSMQLEISLKTFQGNGTAYARLFDASDGYEIFGSDVASSTENYSWGSSAKFKLPSGSKTYKIQLKTLTGYEAAIENARIKVNF